jgi:uncharacterized protein YjbI with pentapeptide repeats
MESKHGRLSRMDSTSIFQLAVGVGALYAASMIALPQFITRKAIFPSAADKNLAIDRIRAVINQVFAFPSLFGAAVVALAGAANAIDSYSSKSTSEKQQANVVFQKFIREMQDDLTSESMAKKISATYQMADVINDVPERASTIIHVLAVYAQQIAVRRDANATARAPADLQLSLAIVGDPRARLDCPNVENLIKGGTNSTRYSAAMLTAGRGSCEAQRTTSWHSYAACGMSIDLSNGNFSGLSVPFSDYRNADMSHSNYSGSDLYCAQLFQANLRFSQFRGANLAGADLSHAGLSGSDFSRGPNYAVPAMDAKNTAVTLEGATIYSATADPDIGPVTFRGANLRKARLNNSVLPAAIFEESDLTDAQALGTNLARARFANAIGVRADFRPSSGSSYSPTNLSSANFARADFRGANFDSANLSGADLRSASLDGATFLKTVLNDADFLNAKLKSSALQEGILCNTRFPDGTVIDRDCKLTSRSEASQ